MLRASFDEALKSSRSDGRGASVSIRDVSKQFYLPDGSRFTALDSISLDIPAGQITSIIGPSGCGKSTLVRAMCGLVQPDSGQVLVAAQSPADLARVHKLGVAFQDHALLPWLSVFDNVALPYRLAGLAVDRNRVEEHIKLVGLQDFISARPKQLSGGMKQRVSIARAIVLSPILLLMDEPFGALDLVTRRFLNLEMQKLWTQLGTTTVLVTHSVEEAVQIGDKVIVMSARPSRINAEFTVDLPRPRDREISTSQAFLEMVRRVSIALDDASTAR